MNKFTELKNEMPTLEVAKKLCKTFTRPLNNHAIIINAVAPMVTKGGVMISEGAQGQLQQEMNRKGMLVVTSPFKLINDEKDLTNLSAVYEGENILFMPESQVAFSTVITSNELLDGIEIAEGTEPTDEMYKKYVVMCMSVHNFSCVLEN